MALIPCEACGKSVSEQAAGCPSCGHPVNKAATAVAPAGSDVQALPEPINSTSAAAEPRRQGYAPRSPRLRVSPGGVLFGLLLLLPGLYAALIWLPRHDPSAIKDFAGVARAAMSDQRFLSQQDADMIKTIAWGAATLGAIQLLIGTFYWDGKLGYCRKCDLSVNARRRWFTLRCERCGARVTA